MANIADGELLLIPEGMFNRFFEVYREPTA